MWSRDKRLDYMGWNLQWKQRSGVATMVKRSTSKCCVIAPAIPDTFTEKDIDGDKYVEKCLAGLDATPLDLSSILNAWDVVKKDGRRIVHILLKLPHL